MTRAALLPASISGWIDRIPIDRDRLIGGNRPKAWCLVERRMPAVHARLHRLDTSVERPMIVLVSGAGAPALVLSKSTFWRKLPRATS
jgi:hypothetical protein